MEPKDPLTQAQQVLDEHEIDIAAEAAKNLAEMVLIVAVNGKTNIQAQLLHEAAQQGSEYLTGLIVAIGLTARGWCRTITGDAAFDPTKYINPEAEAFCEVPGDGFAHYLVAEILRVEDVPHADRLRREMANFMAKRSLDEWGHVSVHVIFQFTDLVKAVLDVCNGDYTPEVGDDR